MTQIKLRDYQREAIDAAFKAWADGMQRPAIVLPTGAGKTVVFASLIKEWRDYGSQLQQSLGPWNSPGPGSRVIVLAHRDELVDQAIAKIRAIAPDLNVSKVKAQDREVTADVMVCSVQTLSTARAMAQVKAAEELHGPVGLVITDECHHAAAATYQYVYGKFPGALQLGVTATMARGDGVGLGSVWEDVVYKRSVLWMISKGYLTDVRTVQVDLEALDMAAVKTTFARQGAPGDWHAGDLGRALMEAEADTAIARAWKEHAGQRQGLVFTPTVETAHAAAVALNLAGVASEVIHGGLGRDSRTAAYESFRKGDTQALVSCMVLTEGFDMPQAEVAMIARPTRNESLYVQMVGRVLRPWPDKKEALVLDLVGASANKLRTLIDLDPGVVKTLRDGESLAEAVVREAEEGDRRVPAGSLAFELRARDVDSFGASEAAWGRTRGGVMFINCGADRVFLWPVKGGEGLWNVCVAPEGKAWQVTEYTSLSIGEAMAWGEAVAEDYAAFSTSKSARWRRSEPSQKQIGLALAYGINPAGMNRGQLSQALDVEISSQFFDAYIGKA